MADIKIILRTPRLILREFIPGDAEGMYLLNNDPDVIRFTGDDPFKSIGEASELIRNYDQYKKYGYGRWTILTESSSEYLGWCGLNHNKDTKETDIGFRLIKSEWGKGIATEAAIACVEFGFNHFGLNKITGKAMKENTSSIRVLEKTGMRFEKEFEAHGGKCIQLCKVK